MPIQVKQHFVQGSKVKRLVTRIKAVCQGEDPELVLMACLSLILVIQHPDISVEDLQKGVMGTSEWVALFLQSLEEGDEELEPSQIN